MEKMWKCKKCGRKFKRKGQSHSCNLISESEHFQGKKAALRPLYNELLKRLRKKVGPFKIEALNCCIHLVTTFTFVAVYALSDQLRISFSSDKKFVSPRIRAFQGGSANRYLYEVNIKNGKEIDSELLGWLKQAHDLGKRK
ncbi:MAG: DUF5655 domain-containing protein [Candidatus ainarchaeum sp.]|nr:DUF5655 domain-containing protein [Candidatus ainarchaeum sp.]